jgi:hypothetical protein
MTGFLAHAVLETSAYFLVRASGHKPPFAVCIKDVFVNTLRVWLSALSIGLSVAALPAASQTFDTAGIKYDSSVQVAGTALQLNGAGVRYKAIFKVYTAGLYLNAKAGTPEAVLANTGPKRMHIVMLREIDANELGKLFTRGMEDNAPRESFVKSIPGTIRMGEIFAAKKKLVPGENFSVEYVPGTGTTVLVNGKPAGEAIKEPEFFNSLLLIWLGKQPADRNLKESLLGRPPQRSSGTHEN